MKRFVGIVLVSISLLILVLTYFPLVKNEAQYQINKVKGVNTSAEIVPLSTDFGIVIPSLGINAKVVKNVSPYDAKIYQKALTKGVAHAEGSALPDQNGNIFIFSHSSENFYEAVRYNSIFYLLPKLEIGDTISLYYANNRYDYHVKEKKIVSPKDTAFLTTKTEKAQLTLMTCYPPGTDFKRFIVIAD